jgi:hypothetical protein
MAQPVGLEGNNSRSKSGCCYIVTMDFPAMRTDHNDNVSEFALAGRREGDLAYV